MSKVLQQYGGLWRWFSEFTSLKLYFGMIVSPKYKWQHVEQNSSINFNKVPCG